MFTPPPSPMPFASSGDMSASPPSLSLSTPGSESGFPFPNVSLSPMVAKSPSSAEAGRERIFKELKKKKSGRRILLVVAFLPALLILFASLRHLVPYFLAKGLPVEHLNAVLLNKRELATESSSVFSGAVPSGAVNIAAFASVSPSVTAVSNGAVPAIPSSPILPTPFPQPFDTLTANFSTAGCQAFFLNFTQDEAFRQCRPFSFLLNASSGFLTDQRNLTLINNVIAGTCNTPPTLDTCDSRMSSFLSQLQDICATDLSNQNPVAVQAQIGFQSYTAMRTAACLEDVSSQRYCYVEALAASTPQDVYFWALPLGTDIPSGVKPTCGACVQSVLAVYSLYVDSTTKSGASAIPSGGQMSGNSTADAVQHTPLPALSKTYPDAARLAVQQCGGTFANVGLASNGASDMPFVWALLSVGLLLSSWISISL
ncbi:hypothetical protein M422DRAFT_782267 [Sphaerobolus stellatus SS14]|uniref:DUF7729 domain-containing protein n=1 Tax=Sphaerobolus stellatus (strain SS14) TaxID=990650 RepID=A0A0C9V3N8_SPHS4|nr:hypothetical protein M422DRAFT_782267 [Sphaerobolus stellatus SS14]